MKLARHLSALSFLTLSILLAGGPLGCEWLGLAALAVPAVPQVPEAPAPPEIPEPPKAPEPPAAPQTPTVDVPGDHEGGVCCIRSGPVEQTCGVGAKRCCTLKLDGVGDCEDAGGLWFHSVDGCRGAC